MLPCENRLIKKKDFTAIYSSGHSFSFKNVIIKVKNNNLKVTRVGIAIGLKFSKKAVKRNKIKRQLREIFRKRIKQIKIGKDIIVMVKKIKAEEFIFSEIEKSVQKVLKEGNLMK